MYQKYPVYVSDDAGKGTANLAYSGRTTASVSAPPRRGALNA